MLLLLQKVALHTFSFVDEFSEHFYYKSVKFMQIKFLDKNQ